MWIIELNRRDLISEYEDIHLFSLKISIHPVEIVLYDILLMISQNNCMKYTNVKLIIGSYY